LESGLNNVLKQRARGLVLLALLAHAFLVGATHFHRAGGLVAANAQGAAVSRPEGGPKAPLANGEEQCLACRLQRNFASGLMRHAAPEVAPPPARLIGFAALELTPTPNAPTLSATGRAPPLS
jgi:hypothetical protein